MSVCPPCKTAGMTLQAVPDIADEQLQKMHAMCENFSHPLIERPNWCDCQHNRWGVSRPDVTQPAGHHSSELGMPDV